ncbi:MAG: cys-tRNA(pro)/cys-tRNA(cys) deacylase [Nanohaloarchaea archaeon QH_8_44_6]|nr:MAG: cys-tRNA(pro)/cys-tRNA(cys) deacylase [Nanohaloarchaea archaeon QH_8_44_6]
MKCFEQKPEALEEFLDFLDEDIENIKRTVEAVESEGLDADFVVHAKSETVEESAKHTGVKKEEIVKTLIFIGERPVAVLCPGDTSVSEKKLEEILDTDVRMANPEEVEEASGYVVGGVSPFDLDIKVLMEESILEKEEVRPAAGSRVVGVNLDPKALKQVSGAEAVDVSR